MSFSPTRVRVILVKELTDYRRNRFVVVFAMIVFPLIFIAAPTVALKQARDHARADGICAIGPHALAIGLSDRRRRAGQSLFKTRMPRVVAKNRDKRPRGAPA